MIAPFYKRFLGKIYLRFVQSFRTNLKLPLFMFQILHGGNVTKSVLHFHPRPSDHGKTVTCRAENTELSHAAIEDNWKLTIHCKTFYYRIVAIRNMCYYSKNQKFCISKSGLLMTAYFFRNMTFLFVKIEN